MSIFINEKRIVPYASGARVTSIEGDDSTLYDMYGTLPTGFIRLKAIKTLPGVYNNIDISCDPRSNDQMELSFLPTARGYYQENALIVIPDIYSGTSRTSIEFNTGGSSNPDKLYYKNYYKNYNTQIVFSHEELNNFENTINIKVSIKENPNNATYPQTVIMNVNDIEKQNIINKYQGSSKYIMLGSAAGYYKYFKITHFNETEPYLYAVPALNQTTQKVGIYDYITDTFIAAASADPIYF